MKTPTMGAFSCSLFSAYFETDGTPLPRLKRETEGSHSQCPASISVFERQSAFHDHTIPPSLETRDGPTEGGFWHHHFCLTPTTPPSLETLDRGGGVWPPPPLHCSNARRRVFLASTTPRSLETQDGGPPAPLAIDTTTTPWRSLRMRYGGRTPTTSKRKTDTTSTTPTTGVQREGGCTRGQHTRYARILFIFLILTTHHFRPTRRVTGVPSSSSCTWILILVNPCPLWVSFSLSPAAAQWDILSLSHLIFVLI